MAVWELWLWGLPAALALMTLTWAVSVPRRDASLVDRVWGLAFVVLAVVYATLGDGDGARQLLMVVLVAIWGLRLSGYITMRNWGDDEDPRYRQMRERAPRTFPWRSLVTVFWLQALLAWLISVPLAAAAGVAGTLGPSVLGVGWLDLIAVPIWLVGFVFEAGGDWQLKRFLADPANRGTVMDRGLWRYTRHPNYFGDTVQWWAYGLLAVSVGAWWALVGPLLMTLLIVRVSGVALTEKQMSSSKRAGRDEYVRRTNAFIPGPRKPPLDAERARGR